MSQKILKKNPTPNIKQAMTKTNKEKVDFSLCWPSISSWMRELPWTVVKKLSEPRWEKMNAPLLVGVNFR